MFFIDGFISSVDNLIIIHGVHFSEHIRSDLENGFTIPSGFTNWTNEWTGTVDFRIVFWTVFSSPVVFTINNTVEDFLSTDGIINGDVVTFSNEHF